MLQFFPYMNGKKNQVLYNEHSNIIWKLGWGGEDSNGKKMPVLLLCHKIVKTNDILLLFF